MLTRIQRHRVALAVSAFILASAYLWAQAGRIPSPASGSNRTISVSGEAVVYVVPDEAIVRFGIETFQPELSAATDANDSARRRLLKALRSDGLAEKDIQGDHEGVEIVYAANETYRVVGYRVRRGYAVTLRDVSKLDDLLRVVLRSGVNHLDGYELRTTELRKYRDDVRKKAVRAAREKAESLAGELGCSLGAPSSIGEGYYGWFGTYGYWGAGGWGRGGNSGPSQMTQNVSYSIPGTSGGGDELSGTPVGQIGVRAQVSVVFEIAPR